MAPAGAARLSLPGRWICSAHDFVSQAPWHHASSMKPPQVSHYRLTEKLGAGTYGEVWRGEHVDDAHFTVAVKLVSPQVKSDPDFISALRRECRSLDSMDHPSIVRFRELVVREDTVAMVLELLEGHDLEDMLGEGPQPIEEVVRVLGHILDGLAYAHGKGVVHRDIKPGNVFRCSDGRVKLLDFGLARAADGTMASQTGSLKGTLDYMAPERFSAGGGGPASDVYAVGLLTWELLTGRRACQGQDLAQKLGWHMGVGLSDVRTVRADCPAWLAELVAVLGAREVSDRPADGAAARALLVSARASASTPSAAARPAPASSASAPGTVSLSREAVEAVTGEVSPSRPSAAVRPGPVSAAPGTVAVSQEALESASGEVTPPPPSDPVPASDPPPPRRRSGRSLGLVGLVVVGAGVLICGGLFGGLGGLGLWLDGKAVGDLEDQAARGSVEPSATKGSKSSPSDAPAPPVGGAEPPVDAPAPPVGGAEPPVDDGGPPVDDGGPPVDDAAPSAEDEPVSASSEPRGDSGTNKWLTHPLRGNDNWGAAFGMVTVTEGGPYGHRATIANQSGWSCGLLFDDNGSPRRLMDCRASDGWWAEPDDIDLTCTMEAKHELCIGTYTMKSEFTDWPGEMKMSRALDRNATWPW